MDSILQTEKECFVTGYTKGLECHHIFYGRGRRQLSEKYGLKVWLRNDLHKFTKYSVHQNPNKGLDLKLKQLGQKKFQEKYPELDFLKVFGRNYL